MKEINYNDIIVHFDPEEWDISYLTGTEMINVLNHPIKFNTNTMRDCHTNGYFFSEDTIFLIVVKQNFDYDYTHIKYFTDICKTYLPDLVFNQMSCNLKYAAVKAGLGQYARNSLFHHPKFQFDTHLAAFQISNKINNLPERKQSNFNLLKQCENCDDCIQACPAHAIHHENNQTWIDLIACDNFCHFGNDKVIPSIKWSYSRIDEKLANLSYDELYRVQNYPGWNKLLEKYNATFNMTDTHFRHFPICRECTSRKKCSKYNGKYPYNWNSYWAIPK